jgi:hypothetical protein
MSERPKVTFLNRATVLLLMTVLGILAAVGPTSWATPDQDAERQTVPTRTPTAGPGTPTAGPGTPTAGPGTPTAGPGTPTAGPGTPTADPLTPSSPPPTASTVTPSATQTRPATETPPSPPPAQGGTAPPASASPGDSPSATPPPESIASATATASEGEGGDWPTPSPTSVAERSAAPPTVLPASTATPSGPLTGAEEGPEDGGTASLPSLEATTATGAPLPEVTGQRSAVRAWQDERRQRWVTVGLLLVMAVLMLRRKRE